MPRTRRADGLTRRQRAVVNIAASMFDAGLVAGVMAIAGAPTWAWLGALGIVYLGEIGKSA